MIADPGFTSAPARSRLRYVNPADRRVVCRPSTGGLTFLCAASTGTGAWHKRLYNHFAPSHKLSFGLIAEEVAKISPDLVSPDKEGKPQTVRYEAVNAMLLNEFLKEHATVQELKKEIAALTATVKEQATQIQKVSAQLEATRSAPQIVSNR